tara:strand:- start:785 stop:1003 length:219 start_codon:yes stop_codon:yes gene_type:complete
VIPERPVVAEDGHVYELHEFERWFEGQARNGVVTSPVTGEEIGSYTARAVWAERIIVKLHIHNVRFEATSAA